MDTPLECSCNGGEPCEAGGVLQSGQTLCRDPLDTVLPIDPVDCIKTGQDGELRRGFPPS